MPPGRSALASEIGDNGTGKNRQPGVLEERRKIMGSPMRTSKGGKDDRNLLTSSNNSLSESKEDKVSYFGEFSSRKKRKTGELNGDKGAKDHGSDMNELQEALEYSECQREILQTELEEAQNLLSKKQKELDDLKLYIWEGDRVRESSSVESTLLSIQKKLETNEIENRKLLNEAMQREEKLTEFLQGKEKEMLTHFNERRDAIAEKYRRAKAELAETLTKNEYTISERELQLKMKEEEFKLAMQKKDQDLQEMASRYKRSSLLHLQDLVLLLDYDLDDILKRKIQLLLINRRLEVIRRNVEKLEHENLLATDVKRSHERIRQQAKCLQENATFRENFEAKRELDSLLARRAAVDGKLARRTGND